MWVTKDSSSEDYYSWARIDYGYLPTWPRAFNQSL